MKVYFAASFHRKDELKPIRADFQADGIEVTSSWLDQPHKPTAGLEDLTEEEHRRFAVRDLHDIFQSDAMVYFAVELSQAPARAGRHVEFGFALGIGLLIIVVGPKENIFHYAPGVIHVDNIEQAKNLILEHAHVG